ncbi:hypothetical protein cypCar_00035914, partial [Cyprinus carpio]
VLALVFIRKLLDFVFCKRDLSWLDDLMPESKKKKMEDAQEEAHIMTEIFIPVTRKLPLLMSQMLVSKDEIMQQEIRPLLAVDIIEQLHRQFALLSAIGDAFELLPFLVCEDECGSGFCGGS